MNVKNHMRHEKKSIALILAMFAMLFVALLVTAFLDMATIDQQITTNTIRGLQAQYLADAGVETAVYNLRTNSSSGINGTVASGYNYTVTGNYSGGIINSTGQAWGFSCNVSANYTKSGNTVNINNWTIVP